MDENRLPGRRITEAQDRAQSAALTWVVGGLLALAVVLIPIAALQFAMPLRSVAVPLLVSAAFALLVYRLRAATPAASALGFLICYLLAQSPILWTRYAHRDGSYPLLPALLTLFLLTFGATRFGRSRKEARGLSESRRGRRASQIIANLGIAGLFAIVGYFEGAVAALAEAAADTVSSEIGQATRHPARLITTGRIVPAGTDGGVTIAGTLAGLLAAAVVTAVGTQHHPLWPTRGVIWGAAAAGLIFDSLLGATVEREGWLGNDLVNFASTLFSATLAMWLRYLWLRS
jgi:uncharacterized protein (TIGR00297 family)